jgi:hypothetical protein
LRRSLPLPEEKELTAQGGIIMKLSGKHFMSFGVMVCTAYLVITALKWPFKTALFPVTIGIPVFLMAAAVFLMDLFGKEKNDRSEVLDFKLSESVNGELELKRTINIFLWIFGWFPVILLIGFPLSVPVYFIALFRFRGKESWKLTIILTILAWAFFYGIFIKLLNTPFMDGWIQMELRHLEILS